jgi:hypothetical protein
MKKLPLFIAALLLTASQPTHAQSKRVTCDGVLVEVDMIPGADFPMAVVYDNTKSDTFETHTCVLDVGRAGHWPLRGACWTGERCVLSGPYFKKIGNTYYMRTWDKAEAPGHSER